MRRYLWRDLDGGRCYLRRVCAIHQGGAERFDNRQYGAFNGYLRRAMLIDWRMEYHPGFLLLLYKVRLPWRHVSFRKLFLHRAIGGVGFLAGAKRHALRHYWSI